MSKIKSAKMNGLYFVAVLLVTLAVAGADVTEERYRQCIRDQLAAIDRVEVGPALKRASEHFAGIPLSGLKKSLLREYRNNLSDQERDELEAESERYFQDMQSLTEKNECEKSMTDEEREEKRFWFEDLDESDPEKAGYLQRKPLMKLALVFTE